MSYSIPAEACCMVNPSIPRDEEAAHLRAPILADSCPDNAVKLKRSCIASLFRWPCRLCVYIGSMLAVVLKLVFIVMSLMLYSLLLMPGFMRMIVYYFWSKNVVRGILYGGKPRQRLDLYFPPDARDGAQYPVVIYVTGGAWTIGYRAWGALLGRRLSEQGVLVACLDYRNFPQGDALDMLEDVNTGIAWVLSHVHRLGGDSDSVTLVGQSAGGHLAGLALIKQAEHLAAGAPALGASPAWLPTRLRAFVGVSGAFDLVGLAAHRGGHFRGLLDRIFLLPEGMGEVNVESRGEAHVAGVAGRTENGCGVVSGGQANSAGVRGDGRGDSGGEAVPVCGAGAAAAAVLDDLQADLVSEGEVATEGQQQGQPQVADLGRSRPALSRLGGGENVAGGAAAAAGGGQCAEGACLKDAAAANGACSTQRPQRNEQQRRWKSNVPPQRAQRGKRPAYDALSPLQAARRLSPGAAGLLPYVLLIHGTADKTVPAEGSAKLCEALQSAGAPYCRCVLVPGKTHTAFLLEDPMRGGRDLLSDTVLGAVTGGPVPGPVPAGAGAGGDVESGAMGQAGVVVLGTGASGEGDADGAAAGRRVYGGMCPGWLCDLAGRVCPF